MRTEGVMGKKGGHWQTDQWTDEVLINKKNGDKNTKVSCSWGWGSCKSEWEVNKQKVTNDSFCLPSRALDHTAGLGGERPRCGCPLTVGRKPSVTKIKKSEAWAKTTAKVHWEQFYKLRQNDPFTLLNTEIGWVCSWKACSANLTNYAWADLPKQWTVWTEKLFSQERKSVVSSWHNVQDLSHWMIN